jgi:hypothetical protein
MGKASRSKRIKRQQAIQLEKYGGVKLSEALIDICRPYEEGDLSLEEYKNLIIMAIAAWNIANYPKEKRADEMFRFLSNLPGFKEELEELEEVDLDAIVDEQAEPPASIVMMQMLTALMRRKDELYPNDDRIVTDFELTKGRLTVSSLISGTTRQANASPDLKDGKP